LNTIIIIITTEDPQTVGYAFAATFYRNLIECAKQFWSLEQQHE